MSLLDTTRQLLDQAAELYRESPHHDDVTRMAERLDTPLRVAVAGKVKAGKSTLLNALVGEELAPTDAGECTKIITWYADGHTYEARLTPHGGESRQVPFVRDGGAIEVDLCGLEPEAVERLGAAPERVRVLRQQRHRRLHLRGRALDVQRAGRTQQPRGCAVAGTRSGST